MRLTSETRNTDESRINKPTAETPDESVELGNMIPLWNGTLKCTVTCNSCSLGFELILRFWAEIIPLLCSTGIQKVFFTIKTRVISGVWKVFTVSGAGHLCSVTQCQLWYRELIFPF